MYVILGKCFGNLIYAIEFLKLLCILDIPGKYFENLIFNTETPRKIANFYKYSLVGILSNNELCSTSVLSECPELSISRAKVFRRQTLLFQCENKKDKYRINRKGNMFLLKYLKCYKNLVIYDVYYKKSTHNLLKIFY